MKRIKIMDMVWKLDDGRIWSTEAVTWITEDEAIAWCVANGRSVIPRSPVSSEGNYDQAGLIEALIFYNLPLGELEEHAPKSLICPPVISPRQCRLALLAAGKLDVVEQTIRAMKEKGTPEGIAAQIEWEFATEIKRDNVLFDQMANMLGLDSEAIDDLFIAASKL